MEKKDLLKDVVEHIDIKKYDSTELINAMRKMSFTSRDTARAALGRRLHAGVCGDGSQQDG